MAVLRINTKFGDAVQTHHYTSVLPIEGVDYKVRLDYNSRMRRWVFGLRDPIGDDIVVGATVLLGVNLLDYARPARRPIGFIVAMPANGDMAQEEPGEFDLGSRVILYYFERGKDFETTTPTQPNFS